jgi:hypothetical protein
MTAAQQQSLPFDSYRPMDASYIPLTRTCQSLSRVEKTSSGFGNNAPVLTLGL